MVDIIPLASSLPLSPEFFSLVLRRIITSYGAQIEFNLKTLSVLKLNGRDMAGSVIYLDARRSDVIAERFTSRLFTWLICFNHVDTKGN